MSKQVTIGLVVPFAEDKVPPEGDQMYPGMTFLPRGVGVRSLTPEGFAAAFDAIPAAADHLVSKGVDAIMVIGTSLTFYRGPQAHDRLLADLRAHTGLPVSSMSMRSQPNAMPPCGGGPYRSASSRKPNCDRASSRDSPITSKTCCCTSGRWMRIDPPPISVPLHTRS